MSVIRSFFSAFLMYSRIPMPTVEWKEENRRYSLCFFPVCGIAIAAVLMLWQWLCINAGIGELLFAAVCVAIPVVVTGGIHLDGFCDVCDAVASCASKEKMLQIMGDPHIGSFAAIRAGLYLIIQLGIFSQIKSMRLMLICSLCFVVSRALSGLAAVTFRSAKREGTLQQFVRPAHRVITVICEICWITAVSAAALAIDADLGIAAMIGMAVVLVYYRIFSYKKFGGITGDLAGYFLQLCELAGPACAVAADMLRRALL